MSSIERCFFLFGVSLIKEVLLYIQKHFRLVTSFEAITANLVDQENFTTFEKVGEDITIKAERVRVHFRECYSYFILTFCCRILPLFTKLRDVFSFLLCLSVSSKFF